MSLFSRPALAAAVVAAALSSATPARARDQLTIGVAQFPSSLNPYTDPEVIKGYVLGFAFRGVAGRDADWKQICFMCASLPTVENGGAWIEDRPGGEKGIAVKLTLRDDYFWGDGTPVTTADLAFTAKVGRDPSSGFADTRLWGRVERVDIIDAKNAVLHYDEVSVLYNRFPALLPAHIEGPVYDAHHGPGEYARESIFNRAPTTPGLYNGPYVISEYHSGENVVFDLNPQWRGQKPGFRRVIVKAIENTAALQANLLSGDVDMAPGDAPALTVDQALTLRKQQPDRFTYVFQPALTYENVTLNLDNAILSDIRVRRALLLALDRKTMVDRLFDGIQKVAATFVSPLDPMHSDEIPVTPYDPARARALLTEAGWTLGDDGIRHDASGKRLSLEFGTTAGNRVRELEQQVMKDQWRAVGIEAVIHNEPARTFFGDTLKHRTFGAMAMFAWTSSVSYPSRQVYGSDQVPTEANAWSGSNYMDWRDPTMQTALKQAETELDPTKQKAAWASMQRVYAEDVPVLPLFFGVQPHVLPKWLLGYRPTGHTDYASEWAEEWRSE